MRGFLLDVVGLLVIAAIAVLGGIKIGGLHYWLLLIAAGAYGFASFAVGYFRGASK